MRRIPIVLGACLIATVLAQSGSHRVCTSYSQVGANTIFYDISADGSGTQMKRYDMSTNPPTFLDTNDYAALAMPDPPGSNWDVGVAFAATMQTRNVWVYPQESQTSAAFWDVLGADGDRWRFSTTINGAATEVTFATENCAGFNAGSPPAQGTPQPPAAPPVTPPPTPTPEAPPAPNCLYASSTNGIYCNSQQTCCGYGTITPTCIDNGSDKQCCVHYKSAKACNSTQTCCGSLGPGASSYSFCCDEGSTCCQATVSYSGSATCCPAGSKCCRGGGAGFCCPSDQECNVNSYTCGAPATTTASPATTTAAPTMAAGTHRVCLAFSHLGSNTIYYEITATASSTQMKRYDMSTNPPTFVDTNDYAALAKPDPAGSNWDVGVAFASTMQTRNAWVYPQESQTSAAFWDVLGEADDRWRFQTTVNGAATEFQFATQNCQTF